MIIELAEELVIDTGKDPYRTEGFQIFVGGKTGSGKSYTLAVLLENGGQFVYLDPHGEGHTLSELGDHVVVASERVGIPIHIDAIPIYVDILKSGKSLVLDISDMYFNDKKSFSAFSEAFIKHFRAEWSKVRDYILLVIDEAHVFAPQKPRKNEQERVDLFGSIASEGRKLGIMLCTATQRPALIDKTAISQANIRLVGKITKSHDFKAFEADIPKEEYEVTVKGKTVTRTRPAIRFKDVQNLSAGQFYAITNEGVKLVQIHKRKTFDAGVTPEAKKKKPVLSKKQTLDSEELGKLIKDAIEAGIQQAQEESNQEDEIRSLRRSLVIAKDARKDAERERDMVQIVAKKFDGAITSTGTSTTVSVPQEVADLKKQFDDELSGLRKQFIKMEKEKGDIIAGLQVENKRLGTEVIDLLEYGKRYEALGDALKDVVGYFPETTVLIDEDLENRILERVRNEFKGVQSVPGNQIEALENIYEQRAMNKMHGIIDTLTPDSLQILSWLSFVQSKKRQTDIMTKFDYKSRKVDSPVKKALSLLLDTSLINSDGNGYSESICKFIELHMDGHEYNIDNLKNHFIKYLIEKEQQIGAI